MEKARLLEERSRSREEVGKGEREMDNSALDKLAAIKAGGVSSRGERKAVWRSAESAVS